MLYTILPSENILYLISHTISKIEINLAGRIPNRAPWSIEWRITLILNESPASAENRLW